MVPDPFSFLGEARPVGRWAPSYGDVVVAGDSSCCPGLSSGACRLVDCNGRATGKLAM